MSEEFNYAVGSPWNKEKPDGSLNLYTYFSQVSYGSLEEALGFKKYVEEKTGEEKFIYKLIKVDIDNS